MNSVGPPVRWTRRAFLTGLALGGTAGLLGLPVKQITQALVGFPLRVAAAGPPPETTTLRLHELGNICQAPLYVAEEFLLREGFTGIQYVRSAGALPGAALASGEADIGMGFIGPALVRLDRGDPIVILAGVHPGCFELFGTDRVRAIRDLKGKTAAVSELASNLLLSNMLAYVGLDPHTDVNFVRRPPAEAVQLFVEDKIDALMALPPISQELRVKKIGRVVVNTMMDRPWSQYFCCMVIGNREFVRNHPMATKRALRAILKSADVTAREPARAARLLIARGLTQRYDYALQTMREIPYGRWRDYDPEDAMRFYALRHGEVGMIKSGPKKLIAQGADWRFLNELKKEMRT